MRCYYMKNVIYFVKHNLKYIVPVLILIVIALVCVFNIKIYKPNTQITTDNFNALDYKDYSGSLTIDGQSDGFKYQWFYSQNMLIDCQSTDLNLIFTSDYNSIIQSSLKSDYFCSYYFPESMHLNGYPTLTVYISNEEKLQDFKLYKLDTSSDTFTEINMAYNLVDDDYSITYAVNDTSCVYVITADKETQTTVTTQQTTNIDTTITTTDTTSSETSTVKNTTNTTITTSKITTNATTS